MVPGKSKKTMRQLAIENSWSQHRAQQRPDAQYKHILEDIAAHEYQKSLLDQWATAEAKDIEDYLADELPVEERAAKKRPFFRSNTMRCIFNVQKWRWNHQRDGLIRDITTTAIYRDPAAYAIAHMAWLMYRVLPQLLSACDAEELPSQPPTKRTKRRATLKSGIQKPTRPESQQSKTSSSSSNAESGGEELVVMPSSSRPRRKAKQTHSMPHMNDDTPPASASSQRKSSLKGRNGRTRRLPDSGPVEDDDAIAEATETTKSTKRQPRQRYRDDDDEDDGEVDDADADSTPEAPVETSGKPSKHNRGEGGKERDDGPDCKSPTNKFGYRMFRYFKHLMGEHDIQELLDLGILDNGRIILPDLARTDPRHSREQKILKEHKFDTKEKALVYRLAKDLTGIAMAMYCEHNLRLLRQDNPSSKTNVSTVSWKPSTIQLWLSRDATKFAKFFRAWQEDLVLFPQMFTDNKQQVVSEEMKEVVGEDYRRAWYDRFIRWEDQDGNVGPDDIRILIRE